MKRRWVYQETKQNKHIVTEEEMKERLQRVWEMLLALNTKRAPVLQETARTFGVKCPDERSA